MQCHVTQAETKPLVANSFKDVSAVMRAADAKSAPPKK
jgi:nitrate reductase cytochrome c-type subunit